MTAHVFVDETKQRGLVVAAVTVRSQDLTATRTLMRELLLEGQERLHFTKESDSRRRRIAATLRDSEVTADIYDARQVTDARAARRLVLDRLVDDLAAADAARLVVERDDSLVVADRRVLEARVRVAGVDGRLRYDHLPPRSEPLLWAADAVAWCWVHHGTWRSAVQPLVRRVITLG